MRYINQTRLDDRIIRTDWDAGFMEGRQFGRGRSGGQVRILKFIIQIFLNNLYFIFIFQVRDEYRKDYDPGRGGYGKRTNPLAEMEKGGLI